VRKRCSFLVRFFIWFLRLRSVAVALCQRLRPVKCQWGFVICDTGLRRAFACGAVSKAPENKHPTPSTDSCWSQGDGPSLQELRFCRANVALGRATQSDRLPPGMPDGLSRRPIIASLRSS
jgi:hypothetical protein